MLHDDRGNARVEWSRADDRLERTPLALEEDVKGPNPDHGYDPYQRNPVKAPSRAADTQRVHRPKRDLRRLSEWIKHMRELEERKLRGDSDKSD